MATLYTKDGVPLCVSGNAVFNPSGQNFGYISGDTVFGLDGRYRGTITNGRLVYRSTNSARTGSARAGRAGTGSSYAHRAGSAMWGDEPDLSS